MEQLLRRVALANWVVAIAGVVVDLGLLITYQKAIPPQVPLLYSRAAGEDQLVSSVWLWCVPVIQLMLGGVTEWISRDKKEDQLLKVIILATNLVAQTVLVLGLTRIIAVIT